MNRYETAKFVTEKLANQPMFARIATGARSGTVGQVIGVRSKFYSDHEYQLQVDGRRGFWVKGDHVEFTDTCEGTVFVEDKTTPTFQDTLGRDLALDQTIIFPRTGTEGSAVEMVMGTIKRISAKGVLYVRAFKTGNQATSSSELIRVACPDRALILDKMTVTEVMLAKMRFN